MAEFILKDWHGKEKTFDHETIYVRGTDGELMPFTHGTGNPVLEELEATENGNYTPSEGVDGFNSVKVAVPSRDPVVQPIEITENGTYNAPDGVDGYNTVTVNVDPTKITLLREQEISGFALDDEFGYAKIDNEPTFAITEGEKYFVTWDGATYETTAVSADSLIPGSVFIGNGTMLGLPGNGEPFAIGYGNGMLMYLAFTDASESHTVGVYQKVSMGSNDVRYVTFMSYDGLTEYGKKAVAVGDDCADPIARGVFGTPTRESDAQYTYTFYGWATEPNGGADADWNKAINEDKTVHANFASAVRYYTITYYDSDGTTVLKTESLAYGTVPSYIPTKSGMDFAGWSSEPVPVTGDTSYTATWTEEVSFATSSWARIAEISESGEANKYFAVGDMKTIAFTYGEETTNVPVRIVGFDHDDLADGSGKAGISIVLANALDTIPEITENDDYGEGYIWENSATRTALNSGDYYAGLPSDLREVLKSVTKTSNAGLSKSYGGREKNTLYTTTDKVWMLSSTEVGLDNAYETKYVALGQGAVYEYFATSAQTKRMTKSIKGKTYWCPTRSMQAQYACTSVGWNASDGSAQYAVLGKTSSSQSVRGARIFGFCI